MTKSKFTAAVLGALMVAVAVPAGLTSASGASGQALMSPADAADLQMLLADPFLIDQLSINLTAGAAARSVNLETL